MKLDLLYRHCADLGVDVAYADLGERHGEYHDASRLIILNKRLTRAQMTTTCAHELAHAIHRDRCSTRWAEDRADETGASLIISPAEYAEAEMSVGEHAGALAAHLGVTPRLILAWRRWHARKAA